MGSFKTDKLKDLNWFFSISNVILYGYRMLKPRVRCTYICLLSLISDREEYMPSGQVIRIAQRRLARAFQMPYATFRSHLKELTRAGLITSCDDGIRMNPFSEIEMARALKVKYKLVKSKNGKKFKKETGVGYTLVPKSVIYGYPELNPGARFLYIFVRSLDYDFKGYEWHGQKKLTYIIGVRFVTFLSYLDALNKCKLTFVKDDKDKNLEEIEIKDSKKGRKFINKKDRIYYNNCSVKEQRRATSFRLSFKVPMACSRFALNEEFEVSFSKLFVDEGAALKTVV